MKGSEAGILDQRSTLALLEDIVGWISSPKGHQSAIKLAFNNLVTSLNKDWDHGAVALRGWSDRPGTASRWLALEIALHPGVLKCSKSAREVTSFLNSVELEIGTAALKSVAITATSWTKEIAKNQSVRAGLLAAFPKPRLEDDPVLAVDSQHRWLAAQGPKGGSDLPLDWPVLERFAEADMQIAKELVARKELLHLSALSADVTSKEARALRYGIAALRNVVRQTKELLRAQANGGRDYQIRVLRLVGRRRDLTVQIWGSMHAVRESLFSLKPTSPATAPYWSDVVALTWVSTTKSAKLIHSVSDEILLELLSAAFRNDSKGLELKTREAIKQRLEMGNESLQKALTQLSSTMPTLESVVTTSQRPSAGMQAVVSSGTLHARVRSASIESIVSGSVGDMLAQAPAEAAIPALLLALLRLSKEYSRRRHDHIAETAAQIQERADSAVRMLGEVQRKLRQLPPTVQAASLVLEQACAHARAELQQEKEQVADLSPVFHPLPEAKPPAAPLHEIFASLTFDPARGKEDAVAARQEAMAYLLWVVTNDHEALVRVLSDITTLQPEAVAPIWRVGVQISHEEILDTVDAVTRSSEWGWRMWMDVLIAGAGDDATRLVLPAAIIDRTAQQLRERIADACIRLSDVDPFGRVAEIIESVKEAARRASSMTESVISPLRDLATTQAQG